jgi:hypothetical protein
MNIEDASELHSAELLTQWHSTHAEHRRTLDEYREWLADMSRRIRQEIPT